MNMRYVVGKGIIEGGEEPERWRGCFLSVATNEAWAYDDVILGALSGLVRYWLCVQLGCYDIGSRLYGCTYLAY